MSLNLQLISLDDLSEATTCEQRLHERQRSRLKRRKVEEHFFNVERDRKASSILGRLWKKSYQAIRFDQSIQIFSVGAVSSRSSVRMIPFRRWKRAGVLKSLIAHLGVPLAGFKGRMYQG